MISRVSVIVALAVLLIASACGGSNGSEPSSEQEPVRSYAAQLCEPFRAFLDDAGGLLESLDQQEGDLDIGTGLAALEDLEGPLESFGESLEEIEPPDEVAEYHEGFLTEAKFAAEAIKAINEGGLFAAMLFSEPPPTPQEPEGLETAIGQECGEDLLGIFESLGGDFFGDSSTEEIPTPPPPGSLGETVSSDSFQLLVHSVEDPYEDDSEFFKPEPGNRWAAVDVSVTNISEETQAYNSFDFNLKDADNFVYEGGFADVEQSLGSGTLLPGDTVRGRIAFELPDGAVPVRLIFEPGFFGEGRLDVDLR